MKTEEQIKAKLKKLERIKKKEPLYLTDIILAMVVDAQINQLNWVLKDVQPRLPSPRMKKTKISMQR